MVFSMRILSKKMVQCIKVFFKGCGIILLGVCGMWDGCMYEIKYSEYFSDSSQKTSNNFCSVFFYCALPPSTVTFVLRLVIVRLRALVEYQICMLYYTVQQ